KVFSQISSGSCSTQPGCGKCCVNSSCAAALGEKLRSKAMARVEVVPWSMARMNWLMAGEKNGEAPASNPERRPETGGQGGPGARDASPERKQASACRLRCCDRGVKCIRRRADAGDGGVQFVWRSVTAGGGHGLDLGADGGELLRQLWEIIGGGL